MDSTLDLGGEDDSGFGIGGAGDGKERGQNGGCPPGCSCHLCFMICSDCKMDILDCTCAYSVITECKHGKIKSTCKTCVRYCRHDKDRYRCTECGGTGICIHGKRKTNCEECKKRKKGSTDISLFFHSENSDQSEPLFTDEIGEFTGSGVATLLDELFTPSQSDKRVCIHGKKKGWCKECGSRYICVHNKWKYRCKGCHQGKKASDGDLMGLKDQGDQCEIPATEILGQTSNPDDQAPSEQHTPRIGDNSYFECFVKDGRVAGILIGQRRKRDIESRYCPHKKVKERCSECNPDVLCEHLKRKDYCLQCGGKKTCQIHQVSDKVKCIRCIRLERPHLLCAHNNVSYECFTCRSEKKRKSDQ